MYKRIIAFILVAVLAMTLIATAISEPILHCNVSGCKGYLSMSTTKEFLYTKQVYVESKGVYEYRHYYETTTTVTCTENPNHKHVLTSTTYSVSGTCN